MRFLAWFFTVAPSLAVGITTGRVSASLDAPAPLPLAAALGTAAIAAYVLDSLIGTLLAHRAARRG